MRKLKSVCIILFLVFIFSSNSSMAADVAKIGIIDFQRVLEASDAGKTAQSRINERGKLMEKELKGKGAEIEALRKKLEREALVMSREMREEKERQIRININDLKAGITSRHVGVVTRDRHIPSPARYVAATHKTYKQTVRRRC